MGTDAPETLSHDQIIALAAQGRLIEAQAKRIARDPDLAAMAWLASQQAISRLRTRNPSTPSGQKPIYEPCPSARLIRGVVGPSRR